MTMTPEEMDRAGRDIAELLKVLVAQMRERGHEKATACFSVEEGTDRAFGEFTVSLATGGEEAFPRHGTKMNFAYCSGITPTGAFEAASAAVRGMAESVGRAYAPYFESQNTPQTPSAAEGGGGHSSGHGGAVAAETFGEGVT